ncbi:class I SAM-dependent methyltransferase [Amycolatopsis taiwanensis]|uniref:Methyltransferase domain-containing protein n=1 Tax=Amycolatopsis taiwanensis TaxID=342230 RepID=A0A9W6R1L9_9PSEU|nr:methyltransferase domain-containing protein [Amycolatopsis taiwanensis]GLY67886.1 hypothetical protein Atai01_45050 [Amycolatopsis taiwanensis]
MMATTYERRLRRGRRCWDLASATYYRGLERMLAPLNELALKHLELEPGERVIDIGCGTGAGLAVWRDAVGPDGSVLGVDYSPRMLTRAQRVTEAHGWPNVRLQRADIARDSLGDNEFDAAVALSSLSATPDVRAAVEIAHAALRPGGRILVFDMRLIVTGHVFKRAAIRLGRATYRATAGFAGADVIHELQRTFATVAPAFPSGEFGTTISFALAIK